MIPDLDLRGLRLIDENEHFNLLADKSGLGLLYQELIRPGPGVGVDPRIQIMTGAEAPYAAFSGRIDLPTNTRLRARDLGQIGSNWRYPGTLPWLPDGRFWLTLVQATDAAPPLTIVGGSGYITGFNRFGPAITPPFPFLAPVGRRLRFTGDVIGINADANSFTEIRIGGVAVVSAQWQNTTRAQHFEVDVWVSATDEVTTSAAIVYIVASPPESIVESSTDVPITGLSTTAQPIEIGMRSTAVTPAGTFKVSNFGIEVTA